MCMSMQLYHDSDSRDFQWLYRNPIKPMGCGRMGDYQDEEAVAKSAKIVLQSQLSA